MTDEHVPLCIKCDKPLKQIYLSGDVLSLLSPDNRAAYCENRECDRLGLLSMMAKFRPEEKANG